MHSPPIASLPLEVLEHIFSLCVPWLYPDVARRPKHPLAFTEVCRIWRWTAFSSPRLWSLIDLADGPLAHYAIHVARRPHSNTPFSLINTAFMKTSLAHVQSALASLIGYASETKNKRISISMIDICLYPCVLSSLLNHLTCPKIDLSNVTKLILRIPPMPAVSGFPATFGVKPQAKSRLPVPIPNVKHLDLDGVSVDWASIKNLRHLTLRHLGSGPESSCLTLSVFQSLLRRSQMTLEDCRLENVVFPEYHECDNNNISMGHDSEQQPPYLGEDSVYPALISLPYLRTLSISALPPTIASIFHTLTLHPSTHIHLFTSLQDGLHTLFHPNFLLDDTVNGLRLSRNSASFLRINSNPSTQPEISKVALSISSASRSPLPSLILNSLSCSYIPKMHLKIGLGIYALSFLTSLTLAPGVVLDIPHSALTHLFNGAYGAVNLRELRLGFQPDNGMERFLKALLPSAEWDSSTITPNDYDKSSLSDDVLGRYGATNSMATLLLPCPNLRLLSFNMPTFKWHNFASAWLDTVLEAVVLRSGLAELERLEFFKCHGVSSVDFVHARMASLFEMGGGAREKAVNEIVVVE